jgi:hypothetical protein
MQAAHLLIQRCSALIQAAALAAVGGCLKPRRQRQPRHRRGPACCTPRPRSTRCRPTATTTPRWCCRTSWKRRCASTTWRDRCGSSRAPRGDARGVGRRAGVHGAHPAGPLLRGRPGLRGRPRELVAQDYVYAIKRFFDPRWNSSDLYLYESLKLPGLSELRAQALKTRQPFRLRPRGRRPARARPLHAAHHAGRGRPALHLHAGRPADMGAVAREVVRVPWRRHRRPSRGHRALPPEELAARLAHRARTSPGFSRLHYTARRPTRPRRSRPRSTWPASTLPLVDEVVVDVVEEGRSRAGCRSWTAATTGCWCRAFRPWPRPAGIAPYLARAASSCSASCSPTWR